jgi:hypothetical protein
MKSEALTEGIIATLAPMVVANGRGSSTREDLIGKIEESQKGAIDDEQELVVELVHALEFDGERRARSRGWRAPGINSESELFGFHPGAKCD